MPFHADPIVTQIQDDMQGLIAYVMGPEAATQTAYTVEHTLFRRLLAVGLALLRLFFQTRAAERPPAPRADDGTILGYHDQRGIRYFSVFGNLAVHRHYFITPGHAGCCPLDADVSLPERCYSDLLREWTDYDATDGAYRETTSTITQILGLDLSIQALETNVITDARDVSAFYDQPPPPHPPTPLGTIVVAQADGKGVPMVQPPPATRPLRLGKGQKRTKKKEAIVTALYTIMPYVRTPDEVLATLMRDPAPPVRRDRPQPVGKALRATLDGKTAAVTKLAQRAALRDGPQVRDRVALTDGAEALQSQMQTQLPTYTLVLDSIHVSEYLWETANALWGETHPERQPWVRTHLGAILHGQTAQVMVALKALQDAPAQTAAQREVLRTTIGYYQRNLNYMHYDDYLARGWPIGTGVVEGACGHVVKDRMEQAGMRWTQVGAQAMLDLRAVRLNGDWKAYWQFHRQRQHERLYGTAPSGITPEIQVLHMAA
jgi:hypothetical protein